MENEDVNVDRRYHPVRFLEEQIDFLARRKSCLRKVYNSGFRRPVLNLKINKITSAHNGIPTLLPKSSCNELKK